MSKKIISSRSSVLAATSLSPLLKVYIFTGIRRSSDHFRINFFSTDQEYLAVITDAYFQHILTPVHFSINTF